MDSVYIYPLEPIKRTVRDGMVQSLGDSQEDYESHDATGSNPQPR